MGTVVYNPASTSECVDATRRPGVVYTKPWVVQLILDLIDYRPELPLNEKLLVEPAAGDGAFLLAAAERLIESCQARGIPLLEAKDALIAFELDQSSCDRCRKSLANMLLNCELPPSEVEEISHAWVRHGDYLADSPWLGLSADFVVGNPPYIRLEDLEHGGGLYRSQYPTMIGRADIYVAFFEAALRQLKQEGKCAFICADRWMFNQYGAELRRFITASFSVDTVVQMHNANAFESDVSAYPAITIIRKGEQHSAVVASLSPNDEHLGVQAISEQLKLQTPTCMSVASVEKWFEGSSAWPLINPQKLALLRRLEFDFQPIESTGATIGIGVATGADKIFITKDKAIVEQDRLLPLAMASDVKSGHVKWSGHFLVNPWNGKGLVDLRSFPLLAGYLEANRESLEARHVGQKSPTTWFRTIDRVNGALSGRAKLYLPDFSERIAPVLDDGETYPHHNLYFVEPGHWAPEVLGGLLMSSVAQFMVESYCVRMRGGYLRLQAQYLRRICLPMAHEVSPELEEILRAAFEKRDVALADSAASILYSLTQDELDLIRRQQIA